MATKAQTAASVDPTATRPSAEIPPPPGGGSWRWDGAAWRDNSAPAAVPAAELKADPVEVSETQQTD